MSNYEQQYEGHNWIKVKKHTYDQSVSPQENYANLDRHHVEETTFLIEEIRKLAKLLDKPVELKTLGDQQYFVNTSDEECLATYQKRYPHSKATAKDIIKVTSKNNEFRSYDIEGSIFREVDRDPWV